MSPSRRQFLADSARWAALAATPFSVWSQRTAGADETPPAKLPVAGVVTVYRRNSHADVILGKILEGWQQDGGAGPRLQLVSLYVDQVTPGDLSRDLAQKHGFLLAKTIDEAVTLGNDRVPVAGVLSIGEHGDYPSTPDTQQHMYPRRRFFEQIVAAFRRGGKCVPVFNDKHLSFRWDDAKFMVDTARAENFPLMAGSSLPTAHREPPVELPRDSAIEEVVTLGYGGFEAYGFHALESHQCFLERRRGGETGVTAVETIRGPALRAAHEQRRWSRELFDAALAVLPARESRGAPWFERDNSAAYCLAHRDGLRSTVLMANGLVAEFAVAVKLKDRREPLATWIKLQDGPPYSHFAYLLRAIERMIVTGQPAYPVERTLLTTGILDRVMQSLARGGQRLETPELKVEYQPTDWPYANHSQGPWRADNK